MCHWPLIRTYITLLLWAFICEVSCQLVIGGRGIFPINFFAAWWKRSTIIKNDTSLDLQACSDCCCFDWTFIWKCEQNEKYWICPFLYFCDLAEYWNTFLQIPILLRQHQFPGAELAHGQNSSCLVGRRVVGAGGEMWWAGLGGQPEPTTALACESPPAWALAHLWPLYTLLR